MNPGPYFIGADHRGYQLKKRLVRFFANELDLPLEDVGAFEYIEDDDYVDYSLVLGRKVAESGGRGILICNNGIGVCVAANKVKGVRAGIGYNLFAAETMMQDDNTNVLCLASGLSTEEHTLEIVKRWLETPFSAAERHERRLEKLAAAETKN